MRDINSGAIVFNLSGGAILITVFAYMGFAFFHTDIIAPCTARYPAGKQFALDSQRGNLLAPIELQGRAGTREWGILKNAQILSSAGGPNDAVMQVSLASTDVDDETARNGVGFTWQSAELAKATSACLSYRVFLPASFAFAKPGYLPGLYAASDIAELDAKTPTDGFVARVGWTQGGDSGVEVRSVGAGTLWQGATVEVGTMAAGALGPRRAGNRAQFERRRGRHITTLDRRKIADRKPLIGTQIRFEPRLLRRRRGHWLCAFGGRSRHSEGVAVCCTMAIVTHRALHLAQSKRCNSAISACREGTCRQQNANHVARALETLATVSCIESLELQRRPTSPKWREFYISPAVSPDRGFFWPDGRRSASSRTGLTAESPRPLPRLRCRTSARLFPCGLWRARNRQTKAIRIAWTRRARVP